MKKWYLVFILILLWAANALAFSGAGQIMVQPKGAYIPQFVSGDSTGFGLARDRCIRAGGGIIQMGPGTEAVITTYPKNANITVLRNFITGWSADPMSFSSVYSGGGYVLAYAYSEFGPRTDFSGNGSGIQSAIDWVYSKGGGKVVLGAGQYPESTAIGMRSNVWLDGAGIGSTEIKRVFYDPAGTGDLGHLLISVKPGSLTPNKTLTGGVPTDSLINITVTNLTLNGNFNAWPTVNPNFHGNFGIQFWYTDNALIENVEVRWTGQTGIELDACRNSTIRGVHTYYTGQEQMLGTRNGININNNSGSLNASVNWAKRVLVEGCFIINQKDAGLDCANVSEVTIKNMFFFCDHDTTYGNMVYEWEGSLAGYTMKNFVIDGTTAIGLNNQFWTNNITAANLENVTIKNCYFRQGDSSVDPTRGRWALFLKNSNVNYFRVLRVSDCLFENLNAGNGTSTGGFVEMYTQTSSVTSGDWKFKNLTFKGVNQAASNSGNRGFTLEGNLEDVELDNVRLEGAEDIGFEITTGGSTTIRNITLKTCYVKGAEQQGFRITAYTVTATFTRDIKVLDSTAEDTNAETSGHAFQADASLNGATVKNIEFRGNKIIRNSGTNMLGGRLYQSGTGVIDSCYVLDNLWSAANGEALTLTGTPTNFFYRAPDLGLHLANNQFLYWERHNATGYLPIMKVDSVGVLRIYPPGSSGTIDFFGSDGTLRVRFPTSGGVNITNSNAFLQLGGFTYLQDNGNERRLFMKDDATGSIVIRNQANNATLWTWNADGSVTHKAFTFATLPAAPVNGMQVYCSDCTKATPCASGGSGAFAYRINGAWECNP